jgi:hypothetical protein
MIFKTIKLSPDHLAENPLQIHINGYVNDQMVLRLPTDNGEFELEAGQLYQINKELDIDIPDDKVNHNINGTQLISINIKGLDEKGNTLKSYYIAILEK